MPVGGHNVLEPMALDQLAYLSDHPNQICTFAELYGVLWPGSTAAKKTLKSSLQSLVFQIRQILEADPTRPVTLRSVYGRGYRFVAPEP